MPLSANGYEWYAMCPSCASPDLEHEKCWGADPERRVYCCCIAETLMEAEDADEGRNQ